MIFKSITFSDCNLGKILLIIVRVLRGQIECSIFFVCVLIDNGAGRFGLSGICVVPGCEWGGFPHGLQGWYLFPGSQSRYKPKVS